MRSTVGLVREMVVQLDPVDEVETEHRSQVLRWLASTDDVFRRAKPAEPAQHLVSYVVPVDAADGSILLVDHINAGLWLPPGVHLASRVSDLVLSLGRLLRGRTLVLLPR
jgi:hypothetical protein